MGYVDGISEHGSGELYAETGARTSDYFSVALSSAGHFSTWLALQDPDATS
jgi:hypothetical protein